jgi:hypothetical protein
MLNLTNYADHPTRIGYIVFRFFEKERADYFAILLKEENISFETSSEELENTIYLFGIRKRDNDKAMNANYLVSARFRNKIIPNTYFRWGLIVFFFVVLLLAALGAILKT